MGKMTDAQKMVQSTAETQVFSHFSFDYSGGGFCFQYFHQQQNFCGDQSAASSDERRGIASHNFTKKEGFV